MTKKIILAAAAVTMLSVIHSKAAYSGSVTFGNRDLLLNLREVNSGTKGAVNITIDLGNVDTFLSANSGQGVVDLSSYLAGTDIATTFGGNLNTVFWTVVAADTGASEKDVWVTRARGASTDLTAPDSTAWTTRVAITQGTAANRIGTTGANAFGVFGTTYGTFGSTTATGANGYDGQAGTTTTASGNWGVTSEFPNPGTEIGTGASFSGTSRGDLYYLDAQAANQTPGTWLGVFQLTSSGGLSFFSSVPEPSVLSLGLMGFAAMLLRKKAFKARC